MSFFETHQEGCRPNAPCARCRLYGAIFKIEQGQFRENILKLVELAFEGEPTSPESTRPNEGKNGLETSIETLDFSVRTKRALSSNNINTIGDLVQRTELELVYTPKLSKSSVLEIKEILAQNGFSLASGT